MKTQTLALFALASSAQLASATFDWLDAKKFSCPANTDNTCIDSQKNGFDWTGLDLGSFSGFGGFNFNGFECADSFDGKSKRDHITGRTFQNKCIKGKATPDKSSAPSFGCGSSKDVEKFSVKTFQVSVEFDCDLEFLYDMPDGSTCKQKSHCKKSGTTVKNTQCGGAKNVKVILPRGSGGGKKSCDVGFHHIDFDCSPPSSTKPPHSTTKPTEPATTPATTPAESEASTTPAATPETPASTTSESSESTPVVPPFPANSTIPTGGETSPPATPPAPTSFTTSTIFETQVSTIISCAETVKDCPAASTVLTTVTVPVSTTICPVTESAPTTEATVPSTETPAESTTSTVEGVTTETPAPTSEVPVDLTTVIIETSTTLCPVTTTHVSEGVTTVETGVSTSTVFSTIISTVCTKCTIKPTAPVETPAPSASPSDVPTSVITSEAPAPTAPCPAVLPQCLNTWLFSSGCKSNTDADCMCASSEFVESIYQCLSAHGASDEEVDSAQSYFQGICAAYIPSNPAIVTGVNTVTITTSANSGALVPVTTVELLTTIVVPCTQTEGPSSGSIIPDSSTTTVLSTALTVPQVVFQTVTGTSTAAVSLVEGTAPASTGAGLTTPVATSVPTTLASVPVASSNGTAVVPSAPAQFTGAGSKTGVTAGSFFVAGLIAMLAM